MSLPTFSSTLSPECLNTMNSNFMPMAAACGQQSVPSLTSLATNTQTILASACSSACSNAISTFAVAANATCAVQPIFQDNPSTTAMSLVSEFALISAIGCVKDSSNSYCIIGQLATLDAAGLPSNSANFLSNLVTYAQKNATFACSTCVKDEIAAAQALTTLDAAWKSQIQTVVQGQALICASAQPETTPAKSSATSSLYSVSSSLFLALLPLFF